MFADFQRIGLGTYSEENREQWRENVLQALDAGYRVVDTAEVYENETYIGEGITQSEVPREDVFLATKTVHEVEPGPEHEDILTGVEGSLDRLDTDYVDLLYVHWPAELYDPETTLGAFDELREMGKVEHVGVCNFEPDQLDRARDVLDSPLFANQIEMHPLLQQEELVGYAQDHDHWIVAFCPLAQGAVFDVPEIREIAQRHSASPAQVSLAWLLSKDNVAVIPKASSPDHLHDNLAAQELELSEEDLARIDGIEREERIIDRDYAPWNC
ncbi:aldo/keto reductase [Halococcus sp. IIIV-5B]|uniref:aldo/keto reductase n=1 Tax=Halococcus sp. IIIV-5B TaxID=2321230 RepID=UPI000E76F72A|nr:aldo/keto reductase [Halococcus sp. IIIV-5B]RJT08136.1 aldo/keto reductase [Halococcus sp. IIIV-5B]